MRILSLKRLAPYGVTVPSVALATVARLELDLILGEGATLSIFAIGVVVASWFRGFWPGLLAIVLSLLSIDYFFFAPKYSIFRYDSRLDQIYAVSFGIFGILGSLNFARLRESVKAKRETRERFRLLVEGLKDYAIFMLDAQGRVVSWSPGAERIKGYRADEIVGRDFSVFFTPEDIESGEPQRILEIAAAEGRYEGSGWQTRKDGSRFWASGVVAAIDDRGRLRGFTIIAHDVTERKIIEERARFFADLNQALLPLADPEEIVATAARMLGEHLGVDRCAYGEIDADEKYLSIMSEYTRGEIPSIAGRWSIDDFDSDGPQMMRANRPYVVNDIEAAPPVGRDPSAYKQAEMRALICVPLSKKGHYVARVVVGQRAPRHWSLWEIELVTKVADRCWEAVERARAVRNMRESEERLRRISEGAQDMIWEIDLKTMRWWWDERTSSLFGIRPEDLRPGLEDWYDHIHPEDVGRVKDRFEKFLPSVDRIWFDEYRFRRVDGSYIHILDKGQKFYDESGTPILVAGAMSDISTRVQTEEALRASEERLDLAQKAGNIGTFDWDIPANKVVCTAQLRDIYGLPPNGSCDTFESWCKLVHSEDRPAFEASIREALGKRLTQGQMEFRIVRADTGDVRWIEARSRIYYDAQGAPLRLIGLDMDITERKRAEAEREELLVREQAAREEAEAASRMKDEFLTTISHELRTPLTSILGWARMLTGGRLNGPQAQHALEVIEQSAQSQTRLVEDVLDTSRIITGRLKLDAQPVAIEHIFRAAVDVIRPSAEAKGISLNPVVDESGGVLLGDANRLQQAIWNLLSNAVKFTNEGGRVEARLGRAEGQIEIAVTDTGIGIEPGFLPHVFDRFSQADSSSTRTYGGLGIGLAIVRHVVEMHGGSVSASSPGKGQGATFKIRLPLISAARMTQLEVTRVEAPPTPPIEREVSENGLRLDGVRVLVVEDDPVTLDLLKFIFDESGAEVITAASVDEALDAFERFRPDALVSDIAMPDRDGCDLIREVRSREPQQGGNIPAVAVTAYARSEDRVRALEAGFQMHIAKPIVPEELIAVVASLTGYIYY